ncbi:AAA family ATPase [Planktothrix pseudagardhii]|uniref:ATP-binding protein n=1 Tax=Planktothrix pseudagardhii TaxID=132604 RepID=A0A9W4CKU5_9CYAN|nr:AAA family ATPase [Planktothrix pseudagardhii]CAD5926338.1 ATP-binding protein [Planktothrix pseudagardhii]
MKVKTLEMKNFRGIGDLTLDFDFTEPTLLVGINGSGKSSILDCLATLLSHFISEIQNPGGYQASISDQYTVEKVLERTFFKDEDITDKKDKTDNKISILIDSQEITWNIYRSKDKNRFRPDGADVTKLQGIALHIQSELEKDSYKNLPLLVYYHVNREFFDSQDTSQEKKEYKYNQIEAYDQALTGTRISFKKFFDWFKELEDLENELFRYNSSYCNPLLEAVRRAIDSLLGEELSMLRIRRSPLRMTMMKKNYELIINQQLSDGEKGLLAMAGDLARRLAIANPGFPDPLQGEGIVLIDEIELHLHPKLQREIIPSLKHTFPNCQFIITTHSPQVISHVKSVYLLRSIPEGIVAEQRRTFGKDSSRILEELMGVPDRPQDIKNRLRELFRLIDDGKITEAKQKQEQLEKEIGDDDPEFASADMLIRSQEILAE